MIKNHVREKTHEGHKMANGAVKLRNIIKQLQTRTMPSDLFVSQPEQNLVRIEKRTKASDSRTEFAFLLRTERRDKSETWWPVEYSTPTEVVSCETVINGRVLVNLVKQESLIELAETWARTLEAQQITKSMVTALR